MAFIPVPGVAQAQIVGRLDGQLVMNDLYFVSEAPPITLGQLQTLALGLSDWWVATMLTLLASTYVFQRTHVRDLTTQAGFAVDDANGAGPGGAGGAQVPNNVAPCISFRTAIAGRSGRGRNYIPGTPQGAVTANTLNAGYASDFVAAYQELLPSGTLRPTGWSWVVVSRFTAGAPRPAGVANAVLSVNFSDTIVDSQRRRLPGRGQ